MKLNDFDPFDHSECGHEPPSLIIELPGGQSFDLVTLLHFIWHYTVKGRTDLVLGMVGNIGLDVQYAALGLTEHEETVESPKADKTRPLKEDLDLSREAWIEEMKALFEKDQKGEK